MSPANTAVPEYAERIDKCATCGLHLPLRLPKPGEQTTPWVCTACGARYDAVLEKRGWAELGRRIRPRKVQFDRSNLVSPPEAIELFICSMLPEKYPIERRAANRHFLTIAVPVIPVDDHFRPTEPAFMAVTRNISARGIALISTQEASTEFAVVEFPDASGKKLQVAMRVLRCRVLGSFFEIAGPFITRMSD